MQKNKINHSRRKFLKSSATFGAFTLLPSYVALGAKSSAVVGPNDKVRLACIGIGHQGQRVRRAMMRSGLCDVVALCDIDMVSEHTHEARHQHGLTTKPPQMEDDGELPEVSPIKARGYTDFRVMFDEMGDEIDAVLIATPDHSHYAATMMALSLGKHVYVEKPLAHTFGQTERLIQMAEKNPHLVTQMGNQGHSGANYFQFKAWSEAGIIKDIERITVHMNNERRWHGWGPSATDYPSQPMPDGIDWEQWHDSVAANRPYSDRLHPQEWRSWYEFGSGCFGDWGPHTFDTPHRFLELGLPERITATYRDGINESDLIYPESTTVQFDFPARGPGKPACVVTWYDGLDNIPEIEAEYTDDGIPIKLDKPGKVLYGKDLVFQGGSHSSALRIVPRSKFIEMRESLPSFPSKNSNHYTNFLLACQGKEEVRSPFSVSGPLTQVFNLGVLAQRFGGTIEFDRDGKQITNNATANALLDPAPRAGWEQYYTV